jgi:hypothetical protein
MDDYDIIYSNENMIYKHKKDYVINKLDIDKFIFENNKFNYQISMFFIEKNLILKESEKEVIFNGYDYIYLQNQYPYKRIILDYIYNIDIYVNLISTIVLTSKMISYIKKKILLLTKKIESYKIDKINHTNNINITTFDIQNMKDLITGNVFKVKENYENMESIFKKISVIPKRIKILYRGLANVMLPNYYIEEKYISTTIDPNISLNFARSDCCFQILYNINVPYVILNDSEKEYIIQNKFYYHKIHVDTIKSLHDETVSDIKTIHYIISVNKLSLKELKEIKSKLDLQESLIKIYNSMIKNFDSLKNQTKALNIIENHEDEYYTWNKSFYKKKYKSLNDKELTTLESWKRNSSNINSYIYFNKSLYYSIFYNLNHEKPIDKITTMKINKSFFKFKYFNYYNAIQLYQLYHLFIFNNSNNESATEFTLYPGLFIKEYDKFLFIYYPGGMIYDKKKDKINIYPNIVDIKKNEIYFGNVSGIFDSYI